VILSCKVCARSNLDWQTVVCTREQLKNCVRIEHLSDSVKRRYSATPACLTLQ